MEMNTQTTVKNKRQVLHHFGYFALCMISLAIFMIVASVIQQSEEVAFDTAIRNIFVIEDKQSLLYFMFAKITWLGNKPGVISLLVLMTAWLIWRYRDLKGTILLITTVILQNEFNKLLKDYFQRERPLIDPAIDAIGHSFPSGHAMTGLLAYGLATYLLVVNIKSIKAKYIVGLIGICLALTIGFSRIVLSAHYPTDVITGHSLGVFSLIVSIYLYNWLSTLSLKRE
ncbi:phosphatase PAP2 family protein [Bacillus solimangrovi]|uniref:Phosphatidic acid phosphatase type 2/haloperoxidase domain-containing protein n=1 Tax=Bacillus solimangrovi TaxID=1305675 RepID=A0A1E5LJ29_9BACI|nr:phosphatase PAP2 family protein [Bacillus solimangrovi]OEH94085.1 hypothetical protein BFG57_09570 [Bacillus solimangrovi]